MTGVVDHHGQIIASIPQFETAVLRTKVTPTEGMTPFTSLGSWPLYVYVLWALTLSWVLARRQQGAFAISSRKSIITIKAACMFNMPDA
ncbi:apolipoprotein N-acyltransferase [Photobacterium aphoticum]|uniref:Apolipoprotein N-acyltransferase n=1 Tax=Photobacterium aphoticum TaxID=754436 RepID=A0A090R2V2_9GAMM|nr:apolipoprotein N-acyltransferase [Photobacterium aphoticum]